jgi:hypothetical protein
MLRGTKSSRLYSNSVIVFRDYISHRFHLYTGW